MRDNGNLGAKIKTKHFKEDKDHRIEPDLSTDRKWTVRDVASDQEQKLTKQKSGYESAFCCVFFSFRSVESHKNRNGYICKLV